MSHHGHLWGRDHDVITSTPTLQIEYCRPLDVYVVGPQVGIHRADVPGDRSEELTRLLQGHAAQRRLHLLDRKQREEADEARPSINAEEPSDAWHRPKAKPAPRLPPLPVRGAPRTTPGASGPAARPAGP